MVPSPSIAGTGCWTLTTAAPRVYNLQDPSRSGQHIQYRRAIYSRFYHHSSIIVRLISEFLLSLKDPPKRFSIILVDSLMMMSTPQGYSSFYEHVAYSPELGIFRKFGAYWAKRIHDETSEVLARLVTLEDELEKCDVLDAKSVLDCPRRIAKELCPKSVKKYKPLHRAWAEYDKALVRHGMFDCP
jgi:hypothetical protein